MEMEAKATSREEVQGVIGKLSQEVERLKKELREASVCIYTSFRGLDGWFCVHTHGNNAKSTPTRTGTTSACVQPVKHSQQIIKRAS